MCVCIYLFCAFRLRTYRIGIVKYKKLIDMKYRHIKRFLLCHLLHKPDSSHNSFSSILESQKNVSNPLLHYFFHVNVSCTPILSRNYSTLYIATRLASCLRFSSDDLVKRFTLKSLIYRSHNSSVIGFIAALL